MNLVAFKFSLAHGCPRCSPNLGSKPLVGGVYGLNFWPARQRAVWALLPPPSFPDGENLP